MAKLFDWDGRKGSFLDDVSKEIGADSNIEFALTEKGFCCKWNATDSYIDYSFIVPVTNISIEVWIQPNSVGQEGVTNFRSCLLSDQETTIVIRDTLSIAMTRNGLTFASSNNYVIDLKRHNHIVAVSTSTGESSIYVNGVDETSVTDAGTPILSVENLRVGNFLTARTFDGNILKVVIYDELLTQQKINALYNGFNSSYPYKETNRPSYIGLKPTDLSLEDGLVAAYNMVPINGELVDLSGNSKDATISYANKTTYGLSFFEEGSFARIEDSSLLNGATELTICFRTKIDVINNNDAFVFTRGTTLSGVSMKLPRSVLFRVSDQLLTGTDVLTTGKWTTITTVWDGASQTGYIYIDGRLNIDGPLPLASLSVNDFWKIGIDEIITTRTLKGEISDLRMYDRVLSIKEIQDYHNQFAGQVKISDRFIDEPVDSDSFLGWLVGSGAFKAGEEVISETTIETDFINGGGASTTDWIFTDHDAVNAGGASTTDWVDTNTDGLADDWSLTISSSVPVPSIVTGNGFNGNAQKVQQGASGFTLLQNDIALNAPLRGRLTFYYRSATGFQVRMFTDQGSYKGMPSVGINTGNAILYSVEYNATDLSGSYIETISFRFDGTRTDGEVDEISIEPLAPDGWDFDPAVAALSVITGSGFTGNAVNFATSIGSPLLSTDPISGPKNGRLSVMYRSSYDTSAYLVDNLGNDALIGTIASNALANASLREIYYDVGSLPGTDIAGVYFVLLDAGFFQADEIKLEQIIYDVTEYPPEVDLSAFTSSYRYIECEAAGTMHTQSTEAYGQWEFDIFKNGSSLLNVYFIGSSKDVSALNGYNISSSADERLKLQILNNGSPTNFINTSTGYLTPDVWYRLKVTRSSEGEFYVYIKGGSFGELYQLVDTTGGSGTNPVTDNTYTTSQYLVLDLDAGDRFRALKIKGLDSPDSNNTLSSYFNITM